MAHDVAALGDGLEYNTPLTFHEAWASVMRNPVTRSWAFNRRPPTAAELLRGRENSPFVKAFFLEPSTSDSTFLDDMYRKRLEETFCTSHRLRDGTQLGFALNAKCIDLGVSIFASFHPCFRNPRLTVNRLIVSAVERRLFVLEFLWLASGGLTVRFACYKSLSDATRGDLRLNFKVLAFIPTDVPILSAVALCPGQPNLDFIQARFENYLVSDEWYMIEIADMMFQSACVFCANSGSAICSCPLPMRRRAATNTTVIGYKARSGKTYWEEFEAVQFTCAQRGTALYNLAKAPGTPYRKLLGSGIVPYETKVQVNIITHGCLQMHLGFTDACPEASITTLTPYNMSDDGRKRLMSAATSSESNSFSAFKPASSRSASSYEHVVLDLTETNKRHRVETSVDEEAIVDEWVNWNDDTEPDFEVQVEAVIDAAVLHASVADSPSTKRNASSEKVDGSLKPSDTTTNGIGSSAETAECQKQDAVKMFKCPECGVLIRNKRSNLKRHIQVVHKKERNFQCGVAECGQRFQTKTNLKRHVNSVHKQLVDADTTTTTTM